jgi:hypothetical protein
MVAASKLCLKEAANIAKAAQFGARPKIDWQFRTQNL